MIRRPISNSEHVPDILSLEQLDRILAGRLGRSAWTTWKNSWAIPLRAMLGLGAQCLLGLAISPGTVVYPGLGCSSSKDPGLEGRSLVALQPTETHFFHDFPLNSVSFCKGLGQRINIDIVFSGCRLRGIGNPLCQDHSVQSKGHAEDRHWILRKSHHEYP